ncbi:hypothetical protein ACQPU1_06035 [Clostridium paraputrificum]|uniref:hypothetical protein n=1 Tax=Clostridium paraputrificum TaxID=29363 RepID=UPI003D3277E2
MKKIILAAVMIISILLMLAAYGNDLEIATKREPRAQDDNKVEKYKVISKKYEKKMIRISYPMISGLGDKDKEYRINKLIEDNALKIIDFYGKEKSIDIKIAYEVKLQNSETLSIVYSGVGNVPNTAYPTNHFYTTNIDIVNGRVLKLSDLVQVDESLVSMLKSDAFILINDAGITKEVINNMYNNILLDSLKNADEIDKIGTIEQPDTFSYLTEDSLGISIGVSHAAGDHLEFEVDYNKIKLLR